MSRKLTIVADENIPLLDELLADYADIIRLPGRQMKACDMQGANALLVRSITPVNAELLAGSNIEFVGTCTIGVDHIDLNYLQENNIQFSSAPGCNALAVVDYVIAALLAIEPQLSYWQNKAVGVVGYGEVGSRLCARLQALNIPHKVYDPYKSAAPHSLEEVLACDAISLHTPLTTQGEHATYHLLNAERLAALKPGTLLINSGRGKVVDNQALLTLLQQGKIRAVLDVYEDEPQPSQALLEALDIATAHIAGYSVHGKMRGSLQVVEKLYQAFNIQQPINDYLAQYQLDINASCFTDEANLMKQAYDIRQDSQNFLQHYLATEESKRAEAFDLYRKNYPTRYELGYSRLTDVNEELAKTAIQLGFLL